MESIWNKPDENQNNEPISINLTQKAPLSEKEIEINRELLVLRKEINNMSYKDLVGSARKLNLCCKGSTVMLQRRLKFYYRKKIYKKHKIKDPEKCSKYKYCVVIDFEATCDENDSKNITQEIIEFPALLLCTKSQKVVHTFHTYVKPILHPELTEYCTSLTGITQKNVSNAPDFKEALQSFAQWLVDHKLSVVDPNFFILTDSERDMGFYFARQCKISSIDIPIWAVKWANVRKIFSNYYSCQKFSLAEMLKKLSMTFEGRPHCGADDAKNISRIVIQLMQDGAKINPNEKLEDDGESPVVVIFKNPQVQNTCTIQLNDLDFPSLTI